MNSKYFSFKLFILLVISLLPINTFAQFTINGKRPAYDKTTNTYLVSIPQNVFLHDYVNPRKRKNEGAIGTLKQHYAVMN